MYVVPILCVHGKVFALVSAHPSGERCTACSLNRKPPVGFSNNMHMIVSYPYTSNTSTSPLSHCSNKRLWNSRKKMTRHTSMHSHPLLALQQSARFTRKNTPTNKEKRQPNVVSKDVRAATQQQEYKKANISPRLKQKTRPTKPRDIPTTCT